MTSRQRAVAAATLALASLWATATAVAQAPSAVPGATPPTDLPQTVAAASAASPVVWLRGPFGTVPGGSREEPATAPPSGEALDMHTRRMPILLEVDDASLLPAIHVVAEPTGPGEREYLAHGEPAFEGPSMPGEHLIVASLPGGDAVEERVWLVVVPDREPPADGLIDIPAPPILVSTAAGTQAGMMASGCYAFLCVEAGPSAPPESLQPLSAEAGETPLLRIADGSALVAWQGRLTPLGETDGESREAGGAITDSPVAEVALAGLEPPGRGGWLLEVRVDFDRERGWLWNAYRLVVD